MNSTDGLQSIENFEELGSNPEESPVENALKQLLPTLRSAMMGRRIKEEEYADHSRERLYNDLMPFPFEDHLQ